MVTLKELFDVMWDITEVDICAYGYEPVELKHRFVFTDEDPLKMPQGYRWAAEKGQLSYVQGRINVHGQGTKNGAEMAWGYKNKSIPKVLMDAEVWSLDVTSRYQSKGYSVRINVYMQELEVEAAKAEVADRAYMITEAEE